MAHLPKPSHTYGLLAEFDSAGALLAAARRAREQGYRCLDAYSPFPVEGLAEALGFERTYVPQITLLGGVAGGLGGYFIQYWTSVVDYPLNVGGRPLHSWPAFIPVTFEMTILGAALAAVLSMLALNRLPMPHHPIFEAQRFALASRNRFFLCLEAADPLFDLQATRKLLESLAPRDISEVPN